MALMVGQGPFGRDPQGSFNFTYHAPAHKLYLDRSARRSENIVRTSPDPIDGAPPFAGLLAFRFDAVDEWYEETQRIGLHPRDPYHRIDVIPSDRNVVIRVGSQVVADTRRATLVFETGLPTRYYLPAEDVRLELLERPTP